VRYWPSEFEPTDTSNRPAIDGALIRTFAPLRPPEQNQAVSVVRISVQKRVSPTVRKVCFRGTNGHAPKCGVLPSLTETALDYGTPVAKQQSSHGGVRDLISFSRQRREVIE
jgi:hypothetical protein